MMLPKGSITRLADTGAVVKALDWIYDRVVDTGEPGPLLSDTEIDAAIRSACLAAGTSGFVTGLGGLLTLPVAIPANIASVAAIHFRLITRIAAGRGYDPQDENVRALIYACLAGHAATKILKDVGVQVGTRLGRSAIQAIAGSTLARINQAVGTRLLTKAGTTGAVNMTKVLPLVGGVVGGAVDAASTRAVGAVATRMFPAVVIPGEGPIIEHEAEPA